MDYEKKYKEMKARVLEIGQGYVKGVDFSKPRQIAEYIDPKLGDSGDEEIRQLLVRFVTYDMSDNYSDDISKEECLAWLEKQGEQKPADMVEPKFKVGDWVIFNNHHGSIYQVEKIEKYRYCLRHYLGGSLSIRYDTDLIRLWTIQDAEDGDVLAGEYDDYKKPWVGIFKCISENRPQRQFDSYCFIISSRHGFITPDSCDFYNFCKGHTIRYTKPATKEQRDLLFQKMYEAGYEWDAEKKELKELSPSEVTKIDDQEQKPAWSAEDEERYLSCLKRLGTGDIRQPETINTVWLKSVKNRIQPKQEWSEEDEAMFQGVIETEQYMLDVVYGRKIFAVGNEAIKEECTKELAWLKSLKDRIK